nr:hypothetical protein [Gammaproteobacteria bacterium]NIR65503.1 hypothetical protein [candidate division Zixibacteria bacterium]NIW98150.1 hypothetical protein [Phycisphaerae bacterium]
DFTVEQLSTTAEESYYIPCSGDFFPNDHFRVYRYNFFPIAPFPQEGSPDNPIIYWLDVQARPLTQNQEARFGWKTRDPSDHFNDDATWVAKADPYVGDEWRELRYPNGHPLDGQSMDLAFELTSNVTTTKLVIDRLVADDWKCKKKTPVTDAVWWGSYIGYQYKPCHGPFMPLPVKPDYFLLTIWEDVPAGADPLVPFSHPEGPDPIWKYKAHEYDEVLVGYDKHPEATPGATSAREPVFRYSVRIPKEKWFMQEDVNNIYWFSVVAVYEEGTDPIYDWGWTNHPWAFNDDAVAGFFDVGVNDWVWDELYDQLGNSQDMSFMLFTDPECLVGGNAGPLEYSDWVTWGKPDCWCYRRQCRGDIDGIQTGPFWVAIPDLNIFRNCFNVFDPVLPPGCICADLDHIKTGPFRVAIPDLNIFRAYFNQFVVPICDQPAIYTGPYNFWTEP